VKAAGAAEALDRGEEKAKMERVIRPGVAAPNLRPRLGQEVVRERFGVAYRELATRSLVNRCDSPRVPFEWTVNPYRGCAMGCRYCYAAYTHEYLGLEAAGSFHSTIYAKAGGLDEAARTLARAARRGERVALGTATDPYQPGEAELMVTRRFLERAAQIRGLRLGITTKGAIILRDLDLLRRIHERSQLYVQVSLTSTRADLLRRLEPWAPPPEVRLEVLRRLAEAGLSVGLSLAPILPGLTDQEADLDELLGRVAAVGVRRMWASLLFLRSPTREKYFDFLAGEFPRYLEAYRRAYAGRTYLTGGYRKRVEAMVRRLREKHGLGREDATAAGAYAPLPRQLDLFEGDDATPLRASFGYRLLS
jgi:DNA repair photolyase